MKYKVERKVAVASISGETVTFSGESGPDLYMVVKSRAARALLLAAGDLVMETTLRPASSFLIAGDNFKEKTGTLTFPVIQITDDTIRIDGKNVGEDTGLDALNDEPTPADPEYTSVTVDEQWKIDRDNALAEGLLADFESFYGSDGPNEMYKATFSSRMFYKDKPLPATPDSQSSADDSSVSPAEPATTEPTVQESDDGVPEITATSEHTASDETVAPAVEESADGVPEIPATDASAEQPTTDSPASEPAADATAPVAPLPVFDPTTHATTTTVDPTPAEAAPADQAATAPADEAQAAPAADTTVTPVSEVTTADGAGVPEVAAPAEQAVVSDAPSPTEEATAPATSDAPVLATPASTDTTTTTTVAPELATTTPAADATTQTHTPAAQ